MKEYVKKSLETNLFSGRIMKEHALFLQASYPAKETEYVRKANRLREQFEDVLAFAVQLSQGMVGEAVLRSGEVVTEFTYKAERQTEGLTGIPIDSRITKEEKMLRAGCVAEPDREMVRQVQRLNQRVLRLLDELIALKEDTLREMLSCDLYTANYPLLLEHILREAKLYQKNLMCLEEKGCLPTGDMNETERFWNRIMMEHALFIRGLLDPTECDLIRTADDFAGDYCSLIKELKATDCRKLEELTEKTLKTTKKYRDFKAAGTEGITGCQVRSLILPLLADHVLREANHYLLLLQTGEN